MTKSKTQPYLVNLYDSELDKEILWEKPVEFNELVVLLKEHCQLSRSKRRRFFDELHLAGEAFHSPPEGHEKEHHHISVRSISTINIIREAEKSG